MADRRVLAIGLDGFEVTVANALMASGDLPALAALHERSARFLLDHGDAKRTGLAWEHISSGLSPARGRRFAAVCFDPLDYSVWQEGAWFRPFVDELSSRTVVFDPPYFDLTRAERTQGVVGWGAHDPGIVAGSRPERLWSEIEARFGAYPAEKWIYGLTWPCPSKTRLMADSLVRAVDARAEAAMWLLSERLPDWELAIVVVSELHSAIEALWHGIDPMHPLHHLPSSVPAGQGLKAVYRAVDRLVGTFVQRFSDATIVTFAAHGMGPNDSDVPGMLLLPELLYRKTFGRPLLREPSSWLNANNGVPLLNSNESWSRAVASALGERQSLSKLAHKVARRLLRHWPAHAKEAATSSARDGVEPNYRISVDWMPAAKYRRHWPYMTAFALPAFYDGRVRLNLAGRERHGKVALERYSSTCDEVEALIRDCRDPRTGETIVSRLERCGGDNPAAIGPTESDLFVEWRSAPLSSHPSHYRSDRPSAIQTDGRSHGRAWLRFRQRAGHRSRRLWDSQHI